MRFRKVRRNDAFASLSPREGMDARTARSKTIPRSSGTPHCLIQSWLSGRVHVSASFILASNTLYLGSPRTRALNGSSLRRAIRLPDRAE